MILPIWKWLSSEGNCTPPGSLEDVSAQTKTTKRARKQKRQLSLIFPLGLITETNFSAPDCMPTVLPDPSRASPPQHDPAHCIAADAAHLAGPCCCVSCECRPCSASVIKECIINEDSAHKSDATLKQKSTATAGEHNSSEIGASVVAEICPSATASTQEDATATGMFRKTFKKIQLGKLFSGVDAMIPPPKSAAPPAGKKIAALPVMKQTVHLMWPPRLCPVAKIVQIRHTSRMHPGHRSPRIQSPQGMPARRREFLSQSPMRCIPMETCQRAVCGKLLAESVGKLLPIKKLRGRRCVLKFPTSTPKSIGECVATGKLSKLLLWLRQKCMRLLWYSIICRFHALAEECRKDYLNYCQAMVEAAREAGKSVCQTALQVVNISLFVCRADLPAGRASFCVYNNRVSTLAAATYFVSSSLQAGRSKSCHCGPRPISRPRASDGMWHFSQPWCPVTAILIGSVFLCPKRRASSTKFTEHLGNICRLETCAWRFNNLGQPRRASSECAVCFVSMSIVFLEICIIQCSLKSITL
eukprot:284819365_3